MPTMLFSIAPGFNFGKMFENFYDCIKQGFETMSVISFNLGPLETNCYIVHQGGNALVIDPGGSPGSVIDFLNNNSLQLQCILLTHLHFDHLYGVAALQEKTQAPVFIPSEDIFLLENPTGKGGMWGFPDVEMFTHQPLVEGQHQFADLEFEAIHTPGHSPGSMSFYFSDLEAVFTGDVLFHRAVGRSDLPGGKYSQLIETIHTKLFSLPSNTIVYPGHGASTSIEDEKVNNPYCGNFVK